MGTTFASSAYVIHYHDDEGKFQKMGISLHAERQYTKRFALMHNKHSDPPNALRSIRRMFLKYRHRTIDFGTHMYIPCAEFGLYVRNGIIMTVVIRRNKFAHLNAA